MKLLCRKAVNLAIGLALGGLWAFFGLRQIEAFVATGRVSYLLFGMTEILIAAFFMARSTPRSVSSKPADWLVSITGSFAPSLFTPAAAGVLPAAAGLIYLSLALQIFGLLSLNRSFAIVPALREVKTKGLYRLVRHPLYAGHLLGMTGYVLANTSVLNAVVWAVTAACLVSRMFREEAHLACDPAYLGYMREVRYRLLPGVF